MAKETNQDDFFRDENVAKSSWMKFSKVGDKIKGTLLSRTVKLAVDGFNEQIVYEILADKVVIDGADQQTGVWNCGFDVGKKYVHNRMKNIKNGFKVGYLFKDEIPSKTKGYSAAKSIEVFVGELDPNYDPGIDENGMRKVEEDFSPKQNPDDPPFL